MCAQRHCDECAVEHPAIGGPVCPQCAPAVARQVVALAEAPAGRSGPQNRALLTLLVAACGVFVFSLFEGAPPVPSETERRAAAYAAIEQVGRALEAHQGRHGSYPDSLVDLVPEFLPELPPDPFDPAGSALRYGPTSQDSRTSPGRILYSLGPDQEDQRGAPLDPLTGRGDLSYPVR